jgi:hypothetical protein
MGKAVGFLQGAVNKGCHVRWGCTYCTGVLEDTQNSTHQKSDMIRGPTRMGRHRIKLKAHRRPGPRHVCHCASDCFSYVGLIGICRDGVADLVVGQMKVFFFSLS